MNWIFGVKWWVVELFGFVGIWWFILVCMRYWIVMFNLRLFFVGLFMIWLYIVVGSRGLGLLFLFRLCGLCSLCLWWFILFVI